MLYHQEYFRIDKLQSFAEPYDGWIEATDSKFNLYFSIRQIYCHDTFLKNNKYSKSQLIKCMQDVLNFVTFYRIRKLPVLDNKKKCIKS